MNLLRQTQTFACSNLLRPSHVMHALMRKLLVGNFGTEKNIYGLFHSVKNFFMSFKRIPLHHSWWLLWLKKMDLVLRDKLCGRYRISCHSGNVCISMCLPFLRYGKAFLTFEFPRRRGDFWIENTKGHTATGELHVIMYDVI